MTATLSRGPAWRDPSPPIAALGWSVEVTAAGDIVQHSGSNSSGFRTFGQFNRDKGSGLVIFTNGDNGSRVREAILAQIGDL